METELERNKDLVRLESEEIGNKGNLDIIDELFSVDIVRHFLPDGSQTKGLEELRERIAHHRKAFPDWAEEIKLIVAEGDYVAIHWTSTGTNTGRFRGSPPTGKRIQTNDMSIFRIVDGKIVEQWLLPDVLTLNRQLGLIPQSP
ncbi:MAG: ester cyclase [candidate division Zixibacteria bacterium]|nr:ester cyclase [candidate division Zixibacteria bacterium]MDH3936022.1 ester cyclase [candidate division Zixibacteria bacterium]MDH4033174.1 ester cyclase [candidate division Zixibacteria bacterium]